jgi:hypothetical protein
MLTSSTTTAVIAFGSISLPPLSRPLSGAPAGLRRFFPMCCNQGSIRNMQVDPTCVWPVFYLNPDQIISRNMLLNLDGIIPAPS